MRCILRSDMHTFAGDLKYKNEMGEKPTILIKSRAKFGLHDETIE